MAKLTWIIETPDGTQFTETPPDGFKPELPKSEGRVIGIKVGRCRAIIEAGEKRDHEAACDRLNAESFKSLFLT